MTTFRSKPEALTFRLTNSGSKPLHVMTELWCDEFELAPGEILEGRASVSDLSDPDNPLDVEIFLDEDQVSLWCPFDAKFEVKQGKKS
jgi:hypothetical protein